MNIKQNKIMEEFRSSMISLNTCYYNNYDEGGRIDTTNEQKLLVLEQMKQLVTTTAAKVNRAADKKK